MANTINLLKLANVFETSLKKYANSEADSSSISTFIVGTISKSMSDYDLQNKLAKALVAKRDVEWEKNNEISGDVVIGEGGSMNAHKDSSGWVVDSVEINVKGSLLQNNVMKPIIEKIYGSFLQILKSNIKQTLNSYSKSDPKWAVYTTISNYKMPYDSPKVFVEL